MPDDLNPVALLATVYIINAGTQNIKHKTKNQCPWVTNQSWLEPTLLTMIMLSKYVLMPML